MLILRIIGKAKTVFPLIRDLALHAGRVTNRDMKESGGYALQQLEGKRRYRRHKGITGG